MKNITKMVLCLIGLFIMGTIAQIKLGNEPAFIIAGIMLFSIGFGWYSKCAKIDDVKGEKDDE